MLLADKENKKVLATNRKAQHDYFIEDRYEAGVELYGTEVKSIRQGMLNLRDSFCTIKDGELWVRGMHISPYEKGNIFNRDPLRPKRLLLHKREIWKLKAKVEQDGYTLVPTSVYLKGPRVKVEIAVAKGKRLHDKRDAAAERDAKREMERVLKSNNRGRYE